MVFIDEGKPWYKVRMGPYSSREKAKLAAMDLKQKHGLVAMVLLVDEDDPHFSMVNPSPVAKETPVIPAQSVPISQKKETSLDPTPSKHVSPTTLSRSSAVGK